jgi:hypothetical protein
MRIAINRLNSTQGTTLMVTLLSCSILGVMMGSYLSLVQGEHFNGVRSQTWNRALTVAEGGVEEAMAHLNSGVTTNNLAVNSWASVGGGNYVKTNYLGDSYAVVTIQTSPAVTNPDPVILSKSYIPGPLSTPTLSRTIRVETKPRTTPPMRGAMIAVTTIDWTGQGCTSDSFISSDTNYSNGGLYDPAKARDHGDLSTLSTNAGAINLANGQVKGTVHTAPGGTQDVTATIGSGGAVGDAAWVDAKKAGWESDHFADDETMTVSDVTLPPGVTWMPANSGKYKIPPLKGTFQYYLDNSSAWQIDDLNGSVYVASSNVVLYVSSSLVIPSQGQIYIPPNCSLTVYVGAPTASVGGQGIVNDTGLARNFTYYGLPTNTYINFGANANFVGVVYAPEAYFALGGGGTTPYDFVGRSVTQSVKMNGHYNFHYDESLNVGQTLSGYAAMSWKEL